MHSQVVEARAVLCRVSGVDHQAVVLRLNKDIISRYK